MIVTCEKCHRRYTLHEDKLRGEAPKVRCTNCQNLIRVPALGHRPGTALSGTQAHWFAMVQGKRLGPVGPEMLATKVRSGEVSPRTFVWKQGMVDWKHASEVFELAPIFQGPRKGAAPHPGPPPLRKRELPLRDRTQPSPGPRDSLPGPSIHGPDDAAIDHSDPFSGLVRGEPAHPELVGEQTQFFIDQSGLRKRNSPWKVAALVSALVLVPIALLYVLSELRVVPLMVTRVDASGQEVKEPVFSAKGVSRLGNLLLGRGQSGPRIASRAGKPAKVPAPTSSAGGAAARPAPPDLKALYGDGTHADIGPRVRQGEEEKGKDTTVGGLAERDVARVVAQTQPAFQFCIEQELRKNPKFRGGKIFISATIGGSGVVKKAVVDRKAIDNSPLGECLKLKARRMIFPAFSGEDTEIQIPLIVGATL